MKPRVVSVAVPKLNEVAETDAEAARDDSATVVPTGGQVVVSKESAKAESAPAAQESQGSAGQETYDQIVLGLRSKLDARNGKAEIRLDPPNLGRVNVSVSLENGTLTAQFQSDSDVVRNLLKDNMEKLKSVLQGQGVAVDRLAVSSPEAQASTSGGGASGAAGFRLVLLHMMAGVPGSISAEWAATFAAADAGRWVCPGVPEDPGNAD